MDIVTRAHHTHIMHLENEMFKSFELICIPFNSAEYYNVDINYISEKNRYNGQIHVHSEMP